MDRKQVICICSGGLDSTVMLYHAISQYGTKPYVLSFNYGSNHNEIEFAHLKRTCDELGLTPHRITLDFFKGNFKSSLLGGTIPEGSYDKDNMSSTVVPFRNGIMLSIAAGIAESNGIDTILLGNHTGDHFLYPDCTDRFIDSMNLAIQYGTTNHVKIDSPFCYTSKHNIVWLGDRLGVNFANTYSCYKGGAKHCGKCGTCIERKEAFKRAGVEDPTIYEE